jgi:ATP/ADP translocase
MFFKKIKNRQFDHVPRFYDPSKDETEKRKKKLRFRTDSSIRKKSRLPVMMILLLLIIIYFAIKLNSM